MTTAPSVSVVETPGIVPLELWDAVVEGRTLFERRADASFYDSLVRAILAHPIASTAARVAVVGGGVDRARATEAFHSSPLALVLVDDDPFFVVAGAGGLGAVVVDAGQTSIKSSGTRGRVRVERGDLSRSDLPRLVAKALVAVVDLSAPIDLVLALPCAVTHEAGRIVLGECSYATEGDATAFVADLVAALAGTAAPPLASLRLVNDAVLAAHAVRARIASSSARTLLLTIGHGVGAALLDGGST